MKFNNKCSFCGNQKFLEIFKNLDNDPYLKLISKNYAKKIHIGQNVKTVMYFFKTQCSKKTIKKYFIRKIIENLNSLKKVEKVYLIK